MKSYTSLTNGCGNAVDWQCLGLKRAMIPVYSLQAKATSITSLAIGTMSWKRQGQQLTVEVTHPVMLDFGAAGKGYLIDIVADILRQEQIESFCVDAGGDMIYDSTQ
jgi:thiamine biosynthesis lipoprotein ApbE